MALADYSSEGLDCFCGFVGSLGAGLKEDVKGLVDALTSFAELLKAFFLLANINIVDELRKLAYQAELEAIEAGTSQIEAPLAMLEGFIKPYADCDPVNQVSTAILGIKNFVLSDINERRYEINQYIEALNDNKNTETSIDRIIEILEDLSQAIDQCG